MYNILCMFLIKIKSTCGCKISEQTLQLTLLHWGSTVRSSHQSCSLKKAILKHFAIFTGKHLCWGLFLIRLQVFRPSKDSNTGISCGYCKILRLPILKNISEWLLLHCFNGSLLQRPKSSRSILHDSVRLQGPSHRSSFLFLSQHLWSWTKTWSVFKNPRQILLMSQLHF